MPWRPLPNIVHAVCVRHFDAAGPDDLTLQLGDQVYITEVNGQENQWCRGWLLAHPSVVSGLTASADQSLKPRAYAGIFPRRCVHIREVLSSSHAPGAKGAVVQGKGHTRNWSAPNPQLTNGLDHEVPPPPSPPPKDGPQVDRATPSPPMRYDSPQAPLVPKDVPPQRRSYPKEPAPLPALRIGNTARGDAEPLVEDISSSIREWHSARLHSLALKHEYRTLEELSTLVDRLTDARRQLAHGFLTEKELGRLREQVVWDLVRGNKMVDGEVIVRSSTQKGRTLTANDPLPDMAELQTVMSLRDKPIATPAKEPHLAHLLIDVKSVPQHLGDPALLHMYLCSVSSSGKPKPVSEAFAVELAIEEGTGKVEIADHFCRTLFAEMNKEDVGAGDQSDNRLYLICRLIRDEPMHRARAGQTSQPNSPNPNQTEFDDGPDGQRKSRRSFVGRRSRRSSDADRPRPSTSGSIRSAIRSSSMTRQSSAARANPTETGVPDPPGSGRKTRRVAGWCAVSVSSLLREHGSERVSMSFWAPATPLEPGTGDLVSGKDGWNDILRLMVRSPAGKFARAGAIGNLVVDLMAFAHDDVNTLMQDKPALLRDIHLTPALSLNGASRMPRSDIYLTLRGPIIPSRAKTFHPQHGSVPISADTDLMNLQVTLEVRTNDGQRIDDAIHPTANRRPHTAFRSPAIERGEAWNQSIKLSLAPKDVPNAHVIMSIADGNNFPFALAWLPLWNRTSGFPPDGQQNLALWDYCEYTANLVDGRGAYQSLPARIEELKEQATPQMACIAVETHLSSTSATQNADVLALSNLERTSVEDLAELLHRFTSIPDEEIAKFFGPILVSLDYVLEQSSDLQATDPEEVTLQTNREISDSTVKALAHAVRLTRDRRYPHLERLLNEYTARRKPPIEARLSMLRCLRTLLAKPFDARGGRELRACLKVTDVLLRFALHRDSAAEDQEEDPFSKVQRETSEFFEDVVILLSNSNQIALPTQVIIMQNVHLWLPETLPMCSEDDTLRFASSAADACASNKSPLFLHRLTMIHNIFANEKFQTDSLRAVVIERTESWLTSVWPDGTRLDETTLQALRICATIIKEQQPFMSSVQSQRYVRNLFNAFYHIEQSGNGSNFADSKKNNVRFRRKTFSPLFPTTYPFRTVSAQAEDVPSELLLELTSVLGAFFQPGSALNTTTPLSPISGPPQDMDTTSVPLDETDLAKSLFVLRSIQASGAFPTTWLSISVSFSRCTVSILSYLLTHLTHSLPDAAADPDGDAILDFDGVLWQHWFDALIALVTSEVVGMENHSEQKRRAVWTVGGDIRELAAGLLRKAWDALGWENDEESRALYGVDKVGGYQVQFTSTLIPSVVMLGLSLHAGLRAVAVEVLKSMIVGEWELSGNLDVVKSAFADALDVAFRDDKFEPSQAKMLLEVLKAETAYLKETGAESLHAAVIEMLDEIQGLIGMLSDVHTAGADVPSAQLEQRVRLLEYLKNTNNEDSYLRHIHDVAETQVENRNYSSAALAMQLHVDQLKQKAGPQTDIQLAKPYPDLQLPSQTIYQRRQMIYAAMVKYFRLGCCWSKVLDTLEQQRLELMGAYDSANLAIVLRDQADTYHKLSTGKGLYMPRFFKVAFSNAGFPNSVSGKNFIFESAPEDDTARFARRLKVAYPMATVVHSGVTSSTASAEVPKIHVISVNVNRDQLNPINQRVGVSPFYRLYHLSSNPSTFSNSTRQQKPGVAVGEQTVAKTLYVTKEKFPTILGRSEIVQEEALVLSPVQAAIDRTHRKTMDIAEVLMNANMTDTSETDKLVQIIRSSVDPISVDSIAAYHDLLLDDESLHSRHNSSSTRRLSAPPTSPNPALTNGVPGSHPTSDPNLPSPDTELPAPVNPSEPRQNPGDARRSLLTLTLTTALQDHALLIEQALASAFDYRLSIKSQLRDHFEQTFEPELYGLYPDGSWRQHSQVWKDALPLPMKSIHPAVRNSIYSNIDYNMSGGAGASSQPDNATQKKSYGLDGISEGALPQAVRPGGSAGGPGMGMNRQVSLVTNAGSTGSRKTSYSTTPNAARDQVQSSYTARSGAGTPGKSTHRRWESTPAAAAAGQATPPSSSSAGQGFMAGNGQGVEGRDYARDGVVSRNGAYAGSAVESETETERGPRVGRRRGESAAGAAGGRRSSFL
ncbi:Dedicator of cytokinesis protein 1 [Sphaceloma murrayae]|uniref:Dedicator of cytokinesis protein 1 n=1 Tax=Sphaceloma murrayae TaxID=2082308 RepID=A0A2K1QNR7_9PEZI|nr:Dedicator of cytokinesis protein 1 [Sphaceloma murrayae]